MPSSASPAASGSQARARRRSVRRGARECEPAQQPDRAEHGRRGADRHVRRPLEQRRSARCPPRPPRRSAPHRGRRPRCDTPPSPATRPPSTLATRCDGSACSVSAVTARQGSPERMRPASALRRDQGMAPPRRAGRWRRMRATSASRHHEPGELPAAVVRLRRRRASSARLLVVERIGDVAVRRVDQAGTLRTSYRGSRARAARCTADTRRAPRSPRPS